VIGPSKRIGLPSGFFELWVCFSPWGEERKKVTDTARVFKPGELHFGCIAG